MDFEIIDQAHPLRKPWLNIHGYFRNHRRQLQDWDANPPHLFGLLILLLISMELVIMGRLAAGGGVSMEVLPQIVICAAGILLLEYALARVAKQVGIYIKKAGRVSTTVTFFNLGLIPLFVLLPISLLGYVHGDASWIVFISGLFLVAKVLSNWQEAMEVSFEFSRLQSAITLYLSGGLLGAGFVLLIYLILLGSFSSFISKL